VKREKASQAAQQPAPPEEGELVLEVERCLCDEATNAFRGSVPVVVAQRIVSEAAPTIYEQVVADRYGGSFHSFLRAHPQFRVFHYDAPAIADRQLDHCSPHEGRLGFANIPEAEMLDRDAKTARLKAERWTEVLDTLEQLIAVEPMALRALLAAFREGPGKDDRYAGVLPSNHALRQLLRKHPDRFVVLRDATVKLPRQLSAEERQDWEAKVASQQEAARNGQQQQLQAQQARMQKQAEQASMGPGQMGQGAGAKSRRQRGGGRNKGGMPGQHGNNAAGYPPYGSGGYRQDAGMGYVMSR